jgi:hypothetical protein
MFYRWKKSSSAQERGSILVQFAPSTARKVRGTPGNPSLPLAEVLFNAVQRLRGDVALLDD